MARPIIVAWIHYVGIMLLLASLRVEMTLMLPAPLFATCLVWKAGPNILLSPGGAAPNQLLQFRRDNLIVMTARITLASLLAGHVAKPRTVVRLPR